MDQNRVDKNTMQTDIAEKWELKYCQLIVAYFTKEVNSS